MAIINNQDDWWEAVEAHWSALMDIFDRVGAPLDGDERGHWWSDGPGLEASRHDQTLIRTLEDARRDRDHETLSDFFQKAWLAAPDKNYIHDWPAWEHLCDLCSEAWVFDPEEVS